MNRHHRASAPTLVVVCSLLGACTDVIATAPDAGMAETSLDESTIQLAATYKTFTHVNSRTDASSVGAFDINIYVQGDVSMYETVHPETTTTVAPFAVGTMIVREVLASDGSVQELTVMAKGPTGYDPTLGDWWFGVADAAGQPVVQDGVLQLGRLAGCHGCHVPRQTEDYLFGVPAADMN
jgi:hypothetical protein